MEPITIHAKVAGTDGYGDPGPVGYDPEPLMSLSGLVAPNHDPLRIAVGRVDVPVKFDAYFPGQGPFGIDTEQHVATVRGVVYEIDGRAEEWQHWTGNQAGDHFTVTTEFRGEPVADSSSSSSSSS